MGTTTEQPRSSGRKFLWLGVGAAVLGPLAYTGQLIAHKLVTPWYVPALGTLAVGLVIVSLTYRRTVWRVLALVLVALLAAAEWHFLVKDAVLPDYAGPVAVGKPLPPFASRWADGTPFGPADLRGKENMVLVFFRGRW